MKIGVISDTHQKTMSEGLEEFLDELSKKVDVLIHAGDITGFETLSMINRLFKDKVYSVRGNMDDFSLQKNLPERLCKDFDGVSIGITHSKGAPYEAVENAISVFRDDLPDILVFGHSHHAMIKEYKNTVLFNPGSLCDLTYAPYTSYGMIEIKNGRIVRKEILRKRWHD